MKDLMILFSRMISKDSLVCQLEEATHNFKELPIDSNYYKLAGVCVLMVLKIDPEAHFDGSNIPRPFSL